MNKNISKIFQYSVFGAVLIGMMACGQSRRTEAADSDTVVIYDYDRVYEESISAGEDSEPYVVETPADTEAERRYKEKYEEVYLADIHLMRADGKKIWYNPWTSENESGYVNKLYVYDSETDREYVVNLNKTSMEDDYMHVDDMVEHDGVITVIMSESRNSDGWVEGSYVWQYNCYTGGWKALAKACSWAEFTDDRSAVRINYAECLNPDAPTYLKEYRNHFKTIRL